VITVLVDIFRRHDIGGWAKAAWVVFVAILPWLGVLVYLIAQHDGMREHSLKQAQAQRREFDDYVRETAGGGSAADSIAKAKELLDAGAITQQEFEMLKAKALASEHGTPVRPIPADVLSSASMSGRGRSDRRAARSLWFSCSVHGWLSARRSVCAPRVGRKGDDRACCLRSTA
jgi:hypothetical protein